MVECSVMQGYVYALYQTMLYYKNVKFSGTGQSFNLHINRICTQLIIKYHRAME